jgi:hypothetical protein
MEQQTWSFDSTHLQSELEALELDPKYRESERIALHERLLIDVRILYRKWTDTYPEATPILTFQTTCATTTATAALPTTSRVKDGLLHPTQQQAALDRLPSMLKALLAIIFQWPSHVSGMRWGELVGHARLSKRDDQCLVKLLRRVHAAPSNCDDVVLRRLQGVGEPVIAFLLRNSSYAPQEYAALWQRYPDLYGSFVPLNVQRSFEQQTHCRYLYRWKLDGLACSIHVMAPNLSMSSRTMQDVGFRTFMMASLQSREAWHCPALELTWLPSACSKLVQNRCTGLTRSRSPAKCHACTAWNPFQINTGATYRKTCNTLFIWRKEEAAKTFVHELMHALAFDFENPRGIDEWTARHFAVEAGTEVLFFEAYVETWASCLNVYAIAAQRSLRNEDVIKMLLMEQQFVMWQVAKVLFFSGFHRFESFFGVDSGRRLATECKQPLQQNTSVFSYFMLRSAHLWDMKWFVERISHPRIMNNTDRPSFDEWFEHLLRVFDSQMYKDAINARLELLVNGKVCDNLMVSSMRMTLFET